MANLYNTRIEDNLIYIAAKGSFELLVLHPQNLDVAEQVRAQLLWLGNLAMKTSRKYRRSTHANVAIIRKEAHRNLEVVTDIHQKLMFVNDQIKFLRSKDAA